MLENTCREGIPIYHYIFSFSLVVATDSSRTVLRKTLGERYWKFGSVYFVSGSRRSTGHKSSRRNVFEKSCQRPIEWKEFLEQKFSVNFCALSLGGSHVDALERFYNPIGRLERKNEMCGSAI